MNQKAIILSIPIVLFALLLGGLFAFRGQKSVQNAPKQPSIASEQPAQSVENPQEVQTSDAVDTSDWKMYRNEEYGFEVKYPKEWIVKENNKEVIESIVNQYVSIAPQDGKFWINFGVVNEGEKDVSPRDFRSGIPAGEFQYSKRSFSIGNGVAEKRYLIYENSQIMLLWFCKYEESPKRESTCEDFPIEKGKVAFLEVDVSAENWAYTSTEWKNLEKMVDLIVQSFHSF